MVIFKNFEGMQQSTEKLSYSDFISKVEDRQVSQKVIDGYTVTGSTRDNERFVVNLAPAVPDTQLMQELLKHNVKIQAKPIEKQSI